MMHWLRARIVDWLAVEYARRAELPAGERQEHVVRDPALALDLISPVRPAFRTARDVSAADEVSADTAQALVEGFLQRWSRLSGGRP